jgi:Cupredoxin-like domain
MNRVCVSALAIASIAFLGTAACGGGSGQNVNLAVNIAGSKMTPEKLSAHENDMVTLELTADKQEEIHLHGYDYKFAMKPGQTQTKTFKADKTGSFEIEIEDTSTHLGELDVLPR